MKSVSIGYTRVFIAAYVCFLLFVGYLVVSQADAQSQTVGPVGGTSSAAPQFSVIAGVNVREHSDGYVEMWGSANGSTTITFPFDMADTSYDVQITVTEPSADRIVQVNVKSIDQITSRGHAGTAAAFGWTVRGFKAE